MNRLLSFLMALLLLCSCAFAAEADEPPPDETEETQTVTTETDGQNITVNVTFPPMVVVPAEPESELTSSQKPEVSDPAEEGPSAIPYVVAALDDVPASDADASTLSDTVSALFGVYTPRTQTVTEYLADGSSVTYTQAVPGLAGLDWPWLASVGLFGLVLYGLLRIIGGLLKL